MLRQAGTANQDPYGEGWLMVIEPTKLRSNLHNLLFDEEGMVWMEEEAERLAGLVADETGHKLAAAGGRIVDDIYGQLPEIGWERLIHEFLLT